ncbi:hypothetical protein AX16_001966 [Volvariella volvacea WC 439]|nr:hypothetical protein AX16_001966 [Volvariella volvacea WC 439]
MKSLFILPLLSSLALAFEWLVGVGKDETTGQKGIGFDPSVINPAAGDTIVFEFRSGAHSVLRKSPSTVWRPWTDPYTESTFERPCSYNDGYNSGVFAVDESLPVDAPSLPMSRVRVNDTNPLWFFDHAGGLCQQGAVLAVNPTDTQTPAQFKENASNDPGIPYNPPVASSSTTSEAEPTPSNNSDSAQPDNSAVRSVPEGMGTVAALYVIAMLL